MSYRTAYFVLLIAVAAALSWAPVVAVYGTALHNEQYSHILLILPVSIALLYSERRKVFRDVKYCPPAGIVLVLLAGAFFLWVARQPLSLSQNDQLSLRMAFLVAWSVTAFVLCYGRGVLRATPFPLLFLFLMVPIPEFILERTVWLLQKGSTDVTFLMLKAVNVPVLRSGFVLSLPGIDIEVAKECSGIRSSLMLWIVGLVLGQLFLQTAWRKVVLALLLFPLAVVKNAIRIFTITTLGIYVDPSYLNGDLHHHGGIVFFTVALGLLMLLIWGLRRSDKQQLKDKSSRGPKSGNPVFLEGDL